MPGMHEGGVMADEQESKEAEVSLSLRMEDWDWLLNYLKVQLRARTAGTPSVCSMLVSQLDKQLYHHTAAPAAGTATDAATVVLDGMKILDPPEPIAGGSR